MLAAEGSNAIVGRERIIGAFEPGEPRKTLAELDNKYGDEMEDNLHL